jgi:tetratricopeptide (TPR) repeat protein
MSAFYRTTPDRFIDKSLICRVLQFTGIRLGEQIVMLVRLSKARFHFTAVVVAVASAALLALLTPSGARAQPAELQEANRLLKAGQTQQALDRANAYLNSKPKDAVGRFIRGIAQSELGKTNDAILTFQSLTEDFPELPEPYNNLAVLYSSKGQFEKARVALELAIQTHPSYATAHENLGDIYAKLASQAYDKALQLDRANNGAATKLNLVRDLFSTNPKANIAPRISPTAAMAAAPTAAATTAQTRPAPVTSVAATAPAVQPATAAAVQKSAAATAAPSLAPATPTAAASTADARGEVLASVNRWAKAWSGRNADGYLASYSKSFAPDRGQSRAAWSTARRERVTTPKKISVEIVDPVVQIVSANEARVSFRQNYASDSLSTRSRKTLTLIKEDGEWKISRERSG